MLTHFRKTGQMKKHRLFVQAMPVVGHWRQKRLYDGFVRYFSLHWNVGFLKQSLD